MAIGPQIISFVLALTMLSIPANTAQMNEDKKPLNEFVLWRLQFDNDFLNGSDDFFTSGWSIQRHSPASDNWSKKERSRFSRWIIRNVPGLSNEKRRVVRRAFAISQAITTPTDLEAEKLIERDFPYAGALGATGAWYAFDNQQLVGFQLYAGVAGPLSFAEETQLFVHKLVDTTEPKGWDNQLKTEPLINFGYIVKRKLISIGERSGWSTDLSTTGMLNLGNFWTGADANLDIRFGWNMPLGFTHIPDFPGRGVMLDPSVDALPAPFHIYFSVVAHASAIGYSVFLDGNTFRDSPHPGIDYNRINSHGIVGLHITRGPFSVTFSYYHTSNYFDYRTDSDNNWANVSLEIRF